MGQMSSKTTAFLESQQHGRWVALHGQLKIMSGEGVSGVGPPRTIDRVGVKRPAAPSTWLSCLKHSTGSPAAPGCVPGDQPGSSGGAGLDHHKALA